MEVLSWRSFKTSDLYSPEVTGEQEDDGDHGGDEAGAEQVTEEVDQRGPDSEEEVEEGRHGMPGNTLTGFRRIDSRCALRLFINDRRDTKQHQLLGVV